MCSMKSMRLPSIYVRGFVKPFRVHRSAEALNMAPSHLFVDVGVVVGVITHSKYVVRSECLFYCLRDECLRFSLWEVVGDKDHVNLEFRGVAGASVVGDAHL